MKPESTQQERPERVPYEAPSIIYEGQITTRAGTEESSQPGVNPADLFGNID
jgi:hypothetical protein